MRAMDEMESLRARMAELITEHKAGEQELRSVHELLAALVNSSPLPIVLIGADGRVTLWNTAAERVFGWTAEEVLGRPLPFIPEEKLAEHRAMRARDLSGEGFREREIQRRRKDGRRIDLTVSTAPLHDASGGVTGIMSV